MEKGTQQVDIRKNFEGNLIQGNYNNSTFIKNEIDGEELGQSLGEALSDSARRAQWEERHREGIDEDIRQIMETVFVCLISGLAIGAAWHIAFPWNIETIPFFVIGTVVSFYVFRITHFGLWHSILASGFASIAFSFLLGKSLFLQSMMDTNQFAGSAILSITGAIIGLLIGIVGFFWASFG